jgi:bacterioferritin-associated ferredoxin
VFVCHCSVVTDRDVKQSLANGSRCLAEVCRDTGAGRDCGRCIATLRTLVGRPPAVRRAEVVMSGAAC